MTQLTVCQRFIVALAGLLVFSPLAWSVSNKDVVGGLKEALTRGATQAVAALGKPDGFFGNERVRIPLPEKAQQAEALLRKFGGGKYADQLVEGMNRAAEKAVIEAKPILWQSIKEMSVKDGLNILKGREDAATQYFRKTTTDSLTTRFRPLVEEATSKLGVARQYEKLAKKASQFGLMAEEDADLDAYITAKALDGLFLMIAEEEKAIRQDPVGTGSALLKKVFGSPLN